MGNIKVEYDLDQWEWQGTTQSIEVDSEDYEGMSAGEIKTAVYAEIRRDAEQKLHLVYDENEVAEEILAAINAESNEEDEEELATSAA